MQTNDELFIPSANGRIEIPRCRVCKSVICYLTASLNERHCTLCSRSICNQRLQASMELSVEAAENLAAEAWATYVTVLGWMGQAMAAESQEAIKRVRKGLARCHERLERRLYLVGLVRVCDSTPTN